MKEFWRSQKCDKFTTYEPTVEQNTSSTAEEQYMLYIQITENTLFDTIGSLVWKPMGYNSSNQQSL
jgi:hypothetical protein